MSDAAARAAQPVGFRDRFERPVLIVSTPRSGSTLLFETMAQAPGLFTVGGESHGVIEHIPTLSPAGRGWDSNRLLAGDATRHIAEQLAEAFYVNLRDRDGRPADGRARMLEKTPKNALRVPFFDAIWPDALFVYLYRDVRQTLASMIEAWRSGRFRTYPGLPGWSGPAWSLLLVPEWPRLNGLALPEIVARQWATTTEFLLDDLAALPRERVRGITHDALLAAPQEEMQRLAASLDLGWDRAVGDRLPLSKTTLSPPAFDKWRSIEDVIAEVWPIVAAADARARAWIDEISR